MVMMKTVVQKTQKLVYNYSTTVTNELIHKLCEFTGDTVRPNAPQIISQGEEKEYNAGTQRLQADWHGRGDGLATQYRSTSEKTRLARCGLSKMKCPNTPDVRVTDKNHRDRMITSTCCPHTDLLLHLNKQQLLLHSDTYYYITSKCCIPLCKSCFLY